MTEDVIDTFRNTTLAANQKFVQKKLRNAPTTGSDAQEVGMSFQVRPFC